MQTRSQTLSQRVSSCVSGFLELLANITRVWEFKAQRMKAMYTFLIYVDKNMTMLQDVLEKIRPVWWSGLKEAVLRCQKNVEDQNAALLEFLDKKERKEFVRLIYKIAKKI